MKEKKGLFENEIEDISTEASDREADAKLIDLSEVEECSEGAQG